MAEFGSSFLQTVPAFSLFDGVLHAAGDGRGEQDAGRSCSVLSCPCVAWVALSAAGGLLFEGWASLDVAARTNKLNEVLGGFLEGFGVAANVAYVIVPHAIFLPILYGIPTGLVRDLPDHTAAFVRGAFGKPMNFAYGIDPMIFEAGLVRLWWYGLAYAIGLLTVDLWVYLRRHRLGFSRRDVAEFSLLFAAGVLLGGRLFDVALYEWFYYGEHLGQIPRLWEGGMATHGVLLGAVAGTVIFCRWRGKSFLAIADEVVIPGVVLMALGRVGNHINGEVYGTVTSVGWAMRFPYAEGCRHPVALYDAAKNLVILPVLLLFTRIRNRPPGLLLGCFVFLYGFLRLFVDHFRDYDSFWFGIGRGQYFNVITASVGLAIIAVVGRYAKRRIDGANVSARRTTQEGASSFAAVRIAFYGLVVLCLTIPSGWTQQVLAGFEKETAERRVVGCGEEESRASIRRGRPGSSAARRRS